MSFNDLIGDLRRWLGTTDQSGGEQPKAEGETPVPVTRCFVVDDEPGIRAMIIGALRGRAIKIEEFSNAQGLLDAVAARPPEFIFLDITLERSDAIEAIRGLAQLSFRGVIQLMSGRDGTLLDDVRQIGERHTLRMLPTLQKPFRIDDVRRVIGAHVPATDMRAGIATNAISLDDALRSGWMRVWYQPKIDLQQKRLVGVEALARVDHPQHGIVLPGSFLPGASDEGLGHLTEFVLTTVLRDWTAFAEGGFPLKPAINVPVNILFSLPIAAIAREHWPKGNTTHGLILEVTEDQIMRDIAAAHEVATQLKIYDISLAIDDFGSGYSSFARLKTLPFSELKLDRSFVKDCATNTDNGAICQMVIDLAHRFGSLAVAEGIETPDDLRALHRMGCDIGQGFLLAAPMPRDRLLALLERSGQADPKVVAFSSVRAARKKSA